MLSYDIGFVYRWTDGHGETSIPPYNFVAGGIINQIFYFTIKFVLFKRPQILLRHTIIWVCHHRQFSVQRQNYFSTINYKFYPGNLLKSNTMILGTE